MKYDVLRVEAIFKIYWLTLWKPYMYMSNAPAVLYTIILRWKETGHYAPSFWPFTFYTFLPVNLHWRPLNLVDEIMDVVSWQSWRRTHKAHSKQLLFNMLSNLSFFHKCWIWLYATDSKNSRLHVDIIFMKTTLIKNLYSSNDSPSTETSLCRNIFMKTLTP